jgi:hypothetical protein
MPTDIDTDVSQALHAAAAAVEPRPDFADRARKRVRARRQQVGAAVGVAALLAGGLGVAAAGIAGSKLPRPVVAPAPQRFKAEALNVNWMAAGGNRLYAAASAYPHGVLMAFDRTSGAPMSSANFPAHPTSLAVATNGTVWVTFSPTNAGRQAGLVEFSADLSQRATLLIDDRYLSSAAYDVEPAGQGQALVATARGLVSVTLPPLGSPRPARADQDNARVVSPNNQRLGVPTQLAALSDGNIATVLTAPHGRSRVVLRQGVGEFDGPDLSVAAGPQGLWVTSGTGARSELRRLSDALAPLPIGSAASTVGELGDAERVWTSGPAVWTASVGMRIRLTCFVSSDVGDEPSGTVLLPAADSREASDPIESGDITVLPTPHVLYVSSPFGITGYSVPAACRTR